MTANTAGRKSSSLMYGEWITTSDSLKQTELRAFLIAWAEQYYFTPKGGSNAPLALLYKESLCDFSNCLNHKGVIYNFTPQEQRGQVPCIFRQKSHDIKELMEKSSSRQGTKAKTKWVTMVGIVWLLFQAKSCWDESPKTAPFKLI